jgi:Mg-chelatase subunit ChlD
MVYWKILLTDGRTGWQVMTDDKVTVEVVDDAQQPLGDKIEYSVVDTQSKPVWGV